MRKAPKIVLRSSAAALALFSICGFNPAAMAASAVWSGGSATDGNWTDGSNWVGGAAPGVTDGTTVNTDVATFDTAIVNGWGNSGTPIVIDNSSESIGGITFATAAGSYTIGSTTGNALLLTSGGTIQIASSLTSGPVTETINAPLVIEGAAYTLTNASANGTGTGAGTLLIGGTVSGAGGLATVLSLAGANTNANTISGNISNGGATSVSIAETGGGTWTLSGSNTYTGTTALTLDGTMNITGALGTLATPTGAISVGNSANPTATTVMNISGATVYATSLTQNNGGGGNSVTTTLNVTNSTITLTGAFAVNNGSGDCPGLTAITSGTVNANSATVQRDSKNFGTTLQTGADTADGLYVHGGTLNVATTLGIGGTTNSSVNMDLASGVVSVTGVTTISNNAGGRYALLSVTGGAFTGGGITFGGATNANAEDVELLVTGGTVTTSGISFAGNAGAGGGTEELDATGGTIYIGPNGITSGAGTGTFVIALGNGSTAPIIGGTAAWSSSMNMTLGTVAPTFQAADSSGNPQNITLTGVLSGGGLTKTGAGTLFLGGASNNTYTGVTTINAGDLNVASAGALNATSSIKFGGGTLQYSSGNSVDYSAKITNSTAGPISIDTNGQNITFATALAASNTGGLVVSDSAGTGSLTITAASAYTGATTINFGATVKLGDGSARDGTLSGSGITNNGTLNLDPFDDNGSEAISISGTGTLTKTGSGKETLGATNTFSGQTSISGGTLDLTSALALEDSTVTGGESGLTFDSSVSSNNFTLGGLSGSGSLTIQNTSATAITLNVGNNNTTLQTYSGTFSGPGTFNKVGTGTLDLTGANTANGAVSVNGGALEIGFGGSLAAGTSLNVGAAGTLVLGDGNGAVSQALTLTGASTAAVVGGASTASTLTLNGVESYSFGFGGAGTNQNNLNLVISGTSVMTGASTYTGSTTINGGGTLNLNGGVLGNTAVTVNSGGVLTGAGNNSATGLIAGTVAAAGGSAISLLSPGSVALRITGGITLGDPSNAYGTANSYTTLSFTLGGGNTAEQLNTPGTLTLNTGGAFINITDPTQTGVFTLANYGSLAGSGGFSLSSTIAGLHSQSVGRDTETLTVNGTSLTLSIAGVANPGVAYFDGAVSTVWNDTSNPSFVNFSKDQGGSVDAGNVPASNTDVVLTSSTDTLNTGAVNLSGAVTTTLGANTTINSLSVNSFAASNTISPDGSTLTINALADSNTDVGGHYSGTAAGAGITILSGAGALTIGAPIILGGTANQTWTNNSSNLFTINGGVTGAASSGVQTLTLATTGAGGIIVNGAISDDGHGGQTALAINNTGGGTTTLAGGNSFSGGVTISNGTVILGNASGLGSASSDPLAFSASSTGLLELNGNNVTVTDLNTNATAGSPVIENGAAGTGTNTLSVNTGNSDTYAGSLQNGGAAALALSVGGSGTFTLAGSSSYTGLTSNSIGTLNLTGTIAGSNVTNAGTFTESNTGVIAGSGITFTNTAGTSTLRGINTFTGTTTITTGTLQLGDGTAGNDGTIADSSGITDNAALVYDRAGSASSSVPISGNGSVTVMGPGSQTLAASESYMGATTVSGGGTLILSGTLAGTNISNGATFNETSAGAISGAGNTYTNTAGAGTLDGSNTYTGQTSISGGSLELGGTLNGSNVSNSATFTEDPSGSIAGGSVTFTNAAGTSTLGGVNTYGGSTAVTTGTLNLTGAIASNVSNNATFDEGTTGSISGAGVTYTNNAGAGILDGSNTYTGATTVTAGSLEVGGTLAGSSVTNNTTFTEDPSGAISGAAVTFTNNSGNSTLGGVNTYTGATTVTTGTTTVTGTLGTVGTPTGGITVGTTSANPTAPLAMNVTGGTINASSLTQDSGGSGGGQSTTLTISGNSTVNLSGALNVNGNGDNTGLTQILNSTVTAGSVTIGRDSKNFSNTVQTAGDTADGLYVNGGSLNVGTTLNVGTSNNSSANMDIAAGTVTVTGLTTISNNANGRFALLSLTGGALTATGGITFSGVNAGTNPEDVELLVTGGTLSTANLTFAGNAGSGGGIEELLATGGTIYIGSGGITAGAGTGTPTIVLGGASTAPIVGASAPWTSSVNISLGATGPTFQAADSGGNAQNIVLSGAITGSTGITKTGAGTLTLGGMDSYSGATNINGGALIVSGQLTGSEPVNANSGGILGGSGNVSGDVNIMSGGTLEPGFGLGTAGTTLTIGGILTLDADADLTINLNGSVSSVSDEVAVASRISIDPTDTLTLDVLGLPGSGNTVFTIATYTATQGESGAFNPSNIVVNGGSLVSIEYAVTDPNNATLDDIDVTIASVPEPGTWAMFFGGIGLLAVWQRSRRRVRG